jgi:hypothetical protein
VIRLATIEDTMSNTIDATDPMSDYLASRLAQLDVEIAERQAQRAEVERTLAVWTDGRSRVNRKRRGTNSAPPATQPEPYDDSVSLEEARGILRTDGEAA